MYLTEKIISWYHKNNRQLPWRNTSDPYKIWVSEIILQQTRVEQGLPYYNRFVERFPTIESLANTPISEVLFVWQGLGYYSRAINMHETAKTIVSRYNGVFPNQLHDLLKLKGIGKYTAAAISSFAYKQYNPVIDGNVIRFMTRLLGIYENAKLRSSIVKIEKILNEQIHKTIHPDLFNQALMEYGALFCTQKEPKCTFCVFKSQCIAFNDHQVKETPVLIRQTNKKTRFFNYLFILSKNKDTKYTLVHKRDNNDIWKGLYDFPLYENENPTKEEILAYFDIQFLYSQKLQIQKSYVHILSHQKIQANFWVLTDFPLFSYKQLLKDYKCVELNTLLSYPFPVLISKFIKDIEIQFQ